MPVAMSMIPAMSAMLMMFAMVPHMVFAVMTMSAILGTGTAYGSKAYKG
jgi:hypothetical protein